MLPSCRGCPPGPRPNGLVLWRALLVLILLLLAALAANGDEKPAEKAAGPEAIARLVRDLDDPELNTRRAAMAALEKLGDPALPALRAASRQGDVDARLRAFVVIRAIVLANSGEALVLHGHALGIVCADLSPDGTLLVTGGNDKTARVWDLKAGKELRRLAGIKTSVWGVSLSPDGKLALAGQQSGDLTLHEVATGKLVRAFPRQVKAVRCVQFLPGGKRAVSASYDKSVRLLDVEAGKEEKQLAGHSAGQLSLAVSRDGKRALTGGGQKEMVARLWDLEAGKQLHALTGHAERLLGVALSPDGKRAATACWDNKVRVWDAEAGKLERELPGTHKPHSVAFSPDGRALAAGNEAGLITLYDPASGRALRQFDGHTGAVSALLFSADGRTLVSASKDNTVRVWRLKK